MTITLEPEAVENMMGEDISAANPEEIAAIKTGADAVAYWQKHGLIGDWADREDMKDPAAYAHSLRRQAETRQRD